MTSVSITLLQYTSKSVCIFFKIILKWRFCTFFQWKSPLPWTSPHAVLTSEHSDSFHVGKCSGAEALLCVQEEAVEYYTKQEAKLREAYRRERERVKRKMLGMAFVTFQNESMTAMWACYIPPINIQFNSIYVQTLIAVLWNVIVWPLLLFFFLNFRILKDFNACKCQGGYCRRVPASSTFSSKLSTHNWTVRYAPDPQNLYWWVPRCFPSSIYPSFPSTMFTSSGTVVANCYTGNTWQWGDSPGGADALPSTLSSSYCSSSSPPRPSLFPPWTNLMWPNQWRI